MPKTCERPKTRNLTISLHLSTINEGYYKKNSAESYKMNLSDQIELTPTVCNGKPVIKEPEFLSRSSLSRSKQENLGMLC
jgi:hypothetical protein